MDNLENVEKLNDDIQKYLESSDWCDLTVEEISLIKDDAKRFLYRKEVRNYLIKIINPLYSAIKGKFKFSNPDNMLTCRNMMEDLMKYYYGLGYSRDQIINIAVETNNKKKC